MKIDNMREEHQEKLIREADKAKAAQQEAREKQMPRKDVGFIAVTIGDGIGGIFRDLGADCLIEGGQTMNPSTEDMLNAIDQVNADTIFIFPNNKNIILAANQAQSMTKDKKIVVIPTKTVPQGITALINYVPEKSPEENETVMLDEISRVKTGQLTYAVRDTHIDDKEIHEGDIMGVGDHGILAVGKEIAATALDTVKEMMDDEAELISVYYGEEIGEEEAQGLADQLAQLYPDCDVEVNQGGQPIYYYIISGNNRMNRQSPLTALKGIGEKTARVFAKAGIFTLEDLLEYYPRSYDSFQEPVMPSSLRDGQTAAVCGTIEKPLSVRRLNRYQVTTGKIRTGSEQIAVTWFNMPYLRSTIQPGCRYVFRGRVKQKGQNLFLQQPAVYDLYEYASRTRQLQPVYPLVSGLTLNMLRKSPAADAGGA